MTDCYINNCYITSDSASTNSATYYGYYSNTANSTGIYYNFPVTYYPYTYGYPTTLIHQESEEEKQARIAHEAEYQRQQEEQAKKRELANQKAEDLLKKHIGLERYGLLYQVGHIEVNSQKYKGRKYRIKKTAYEQIEILENGKVIDRLCIIPRINCPDGDRLLTKIVLAESDEEYLLKTSNHFPAN